jgi:hypothetical protein
VGDQAVSGSACECQGEPERRRFTTSVEPVRVTTLDRSLGVKVRRTVGHRFRCTCGERGSRRRTPAEARSEGRRHVFDVHVESPSATASPSGETERAPS